MTIVSNSDIETAQKCEQMFYYSRILKIKPKEMSVYIRRGLFGHDMMEAAFTVIMNGGTVDEAMAAATVILEKMMDSDEPEKAEMMKVFRHVNTFVHFSQDEQVFWRPVALEDRGMWNITHDRATTKEEATANPTDLVFGYTPDIVVEFTKGPFKGQRAVLDYKFIGKYMSEVAINMAQQIPKYIIYRNKTNPDEKIHRGAFVQLNTRADVNSKGHQVFLIKWVTPSKHRLERIEHENKLWAERVAGLYDKEPGDFLRTVNKDVCDWCFFGKELCPTDFDGKPVDKILAREYVVNDYGY